MRIVVHFNDLTGKIKGSDRSRLEIATRLARRHEVIALANHTGAEELPFQVIKLPKPKALAFYHYYLEELKLKPDAVITKTFFGDAPSLAIAHTGSVEKMFREDSKWKKPEDWKVSKRVIELTMANATVLVSRTEGMAGEIKEIYGIDSVVIPNGVDTKLYRPLSLTRTPNRVMMAGTLSHRKGVETLAQVIAATPELDWRICGDGPLRKLLEPLPNVTLLGWLGPSEMAREYNQAKAFVLPSRYDPFPLVVLEAMACNTPVVISRGVTVGSLVDREVGRVVEIDDAQGFAAGVRKVVESDFADKPRKRSLDHDWKKITEAYEKILTDIANSSIPKPRSYTYKRD